MDIQYFVYIVKDRRDGKVWIASSEKNIDDFVQIGRYQAVLKMGPNKGRPMVAMHGHHLNRIEAEDLMERMRIEALRVGYTLKPRGYSRKI